MIQKAILMSASGRITAEDLQLRTGAAPGENPANAVRTLKEIRFEAEKSAIEAVLAKTSGKVSLAAKLLDVDRIWLMKLMEESGLRADDYRK